MSSFFTGSKKKAVPVKVEPVVNPVVKQGSGVIRKKKKVVFQKEQKEWADEIDRDLVPLSECDLDSLVKDYNDPEDKVPLTVVRPVGGQKAVSSGLSGQVQIGPVLEHSTLSLDSIRFGFMSDDEVEKYSVIKITETKQSGPNSLYDLRLGPLNNHEICETCHAEWKLCPGHFGYIPLAVKIPHPLRSKVILDFLSLFCSNENCNRLVLSEDKINLLGIDRCSGDVKFNKILREVKDVKVCCHCSSVLPKFMCEEDKYFMVFKEKKYFISYAQIENTFSNIPEQDIDYIGLDSQYVHPLRFMIGNLPVVPPCARMIVRGEDAVSHDDLFYQYQNILKCNIKIEEFIRTNRPGTPVAQEMIDSLVFHVKTLMDNNRGKARSSAGKRSIKCIKKRLSHKSGLIRGNIQGKRVDFCARTVITPEAVGMLDEVVVPEHIAKVITFPVRVNRINLKKCQKLLDDGLVRKIHRGNNVYDADIACFTKGFELQDTDVVRSGGKYFSALSYFYAKNKKYVLQPDDKVFRSGKLVENIQPPRRKDFVLQEGDVIDRQLQDGDWTILNRQPTLWKGSMRAKKVKIRPGLTFRFSLASTQAYNADYDGDEMNLFFAQSEETRVECMQILSTSENFTSGQDSKPMISIKQDGMTGGYKLTYGKVKIDIDLFNDCLTTEYFDLSDIMRKFDHIKKVLRWKGVLQDNDELQDKLVALRIALRQIKNLYSSSQSKEKREQLRAAFNSAKEEIKETEKAISEWDKEQLREHFYIGRILFSFLLPDDFEYFCDNKMSPDKSPVVITRGVMLSGTLSKSAIGSSSGSLIHHIYKDYGQDAAVRFVSYYEQLINAWFPSWGFSVGLEDCIPTKIEVIDNEIEKCFAEATAVMQHERNLFLAEAKVKRVLNKATQIGQKIAAESLNRENNIVAMIRSGAKGSEFNIAQVTGVVGQQNVSGERIIKNFGGRSLPHFPVTKSLSCSPDNIDAALYEPGKEKQLIDAAKSLFKSRGFVSNSYYKGLDPIEFFFHAAGGREGLIDTACKTATTGYTQRKITKVIEDLKVDYTGVVNNARNTVVQFNYGSDNLDPSRLINTKCGLSFIDIAHTVEKLNNDYLFKK